jgi:hypothetical protein
MIRVVADDGVYADVPEHLAKPEQVGFFLADYHASTAPFKLRAWRPVLEDGYELQTPVHVALTDETRAEMIQWAWDEGMSLVEIHSHGSAAPAEFSPSDRYGFEEWVPHLWWRLKAKPYAALVWADASFDGWGWIDDPRVPRQVDGLVVGEAMRKASQATFAGLERRRRLAGA